MVVDQLVLALAINFEESEQQIHAQNSVAAALQSCLRPKESRSVVSGSTLAAFESEQQGLLDSFGCNSARQNSLAGLLTAVCGALDVRPRKNLHSDER